MSSLSIPANTLAIITENEIYDSSVPEIVEPLKGNKKRDWFTDHFYRCLPLVIGNQYGFLIKSFYDWTAIWDGSESPSGVKVKVNRTDNIEYQLINSHFGSGIVTIQNRFHFRTPSGINLMTMNPPNFLLNNLQNLTGVIETDNLRRDFTFNLKITVPNVEVRISKAQPIAAVFPVQRYFVDNFEIKMANELFSSEEINKEREMGEKFSHERKNVDIKNPHQTGKRYLKGEDADGRKFNDHQTKLK